ncbi:MAG: 3-dehydroquinate synthase [Actinomycetes bacterium]
MTTIHVFADSTYPVLVESGASHHVTRFIEDADRVAIIHAPHLRQAAETLRKDFRNIQSITIEIPDAEAAKSTAVLDFCWNALGDAGFTRNDVIVSLGGGATTDLAGFVAATWLRGVRIIHIPTTLLGMVDAAVGGKTGINTSIGKNLVGSFYSPSAVLCDTNFLLTQSTDDYIGGLAEIIKAGFIRDSRILELIEENPFEARLPTWKHTEEIISRAIQVKADVVTGDLKEKLGTSVGREILNYGHTFAHAIERTENYAWRHGYAVSVGMVYVAELAHLAGRLPTHILNRHRTILQSVGLPTHYDGDKWPELFDAMKMDKKTRGAKMRFIILESIGTPAILEGPDTALLFAAYQQVVKG